MLSYCVDLVRLLSHTSGNTTAITAGEILAIVVDIAGQIAKANWEKMQPFYLQSNTFNIQGSSNLYRSSYTALSPYMDKFVHAMFLRGTTRIPIKIVDADDPKARTSLAAEYISVAAAKLVLLILALR